MSLSNDAVADRSPGSRPVRVLRGPLASEQPFIVLWEVTRACALACRHCRADAVHHRSPEELSTSEALALVDDLASCPAPRPLLVVTGGDPFERDDLVDIVRHATLRNLHVAISPSVTPKLTRARLGELRAAGAAAVSLSLDGATAATHDAMRGIPGVHAATLEAAATVRELGYRLQINTTVHRGNVGELADLLAWMLGADVSLWSVFLLVPTGRGTALEPLDPVEVEDLMHWLHEVGGHVPVKTTEGPHFRRVAVERAGVPQNELDTVFPPGPLRAGLRARTGALVGANPPTGRRRPPLDVNAGRGAVFVDHRGDVFPSGFLPLVAGSVRDAPLTAIYRRSPLLRALRDPDALVGVCGRCAHRAVCGGSRSRAYASTGDPFADDPACLVAAAGAASSDPPADPPADP